MIDGIKIYIIKDIQEIIPISCPYCGNKDCLGIVFTDELYFVCGKTGKRITTKQLRKSMDAELVRMITERGKEDIYYLDEE